MNLKHDRLITISVGMNRKDLNWRPQVLTVGDLWERLQVPQRSTESQAEYLKMKKGKQDELKDVGGYVAGTLNGPRRKASAVTGRDVVTLDFDTVQAYGTENVKAALVKLGCAFAMYSTRKHMPTQPRLRVLLPLSRTVTADEYEPIARRLAALIGINMCDPSTFEPSRLMYWPSVSADGEYVFSYTDEMFCDADVLLATYSDWHDMTQWPQVAGANAYQKMAMKQGDPDEKPGMVGIFNRAYENVFNVMDTILAGIYEPCDNDPHRFTYAGGTTTGGAIAYDDGKFLFSHHATDPCGGRLVNCFDLVRLHKFGDLDDKVTEDMAHNRLPSYIAMCEFCVSDERTAAFMAKERRDSAMKDFEDLANPPQPSEEQGKPTQPRSPEVEVDWMKRLDISPQTGQVKPTIDNIRIILECDPNLSGRFALNEFSGRGEVLTALPWCADNKRRMWQDSDLNGLYWYMEKVYNINKRGNVDVALDVHSTTHSFNEVADWINALEWDGQRRLDRLLIDFLGARDEPYVQAVTRKAFTACIARAMDPGCKYDNMLILCGPQGIGKSTILDRMSRGYFNDSIRTFEGKEASELLQGVWIVEIAELDAFRRTDVARIKQFLSLRADRYRAAYGRNVKECPRRSVFFGTCNQMDFLQDATGNRRFWPVDVGQFPHPFNVWDDLTDSYTSQVWAEAKVRWQLGEELFLKGEFELIAQERQEEHREENPREGLIREFVERRVPTDWYQWPLDRRRDYWAGMDKVGAYELMERDRITAAEVLAEAFGRNPRDWQRQDFREVNAVLQTLKGWTRKKVKPGVDYGVVWGFIPKTQSLDEVAEEMSYTQDAAGC